MVLVQKWPFLKTFFFRQYRPRKCLLRYSRRKKRLSKWPFFKLFCLGNIGQENVCYDILEGKNAFLGYKNKKFKQSKNWHFSKAVNPCFWSTNGHFSNNSFMQYRPGKCLLRYSRPKNAFLGYKIKKFKSRKIDISPKGYVKPWFWSKNCSLSNFSV